MDRQKTPYKILTILQDGQFHSGEELGAKLSITRSAIWKAIKQLSEIGIPILSITGRGYCIKGGLNLLNQATIDGFIDPNVRSQLHLELFDQVESTNDILLKRSNNNHYDVAIAEQQTDGRGRCARHWVSPYGHNIYCSIRWNSNRDPFELSGLSLAIAVSIVRTLIQYGIDKSSIGLKWPNDVLIKQEKVAGTLIELKAESHSKTSAIIGIGINTFLSDCDADHIEQAWTTLQTQLQTPIDRNKLAGLLINNTIQVLREFANNGLSHFITEWQTHDIYLNKPIKLTNGTTILEGTYQGITPRGELILLDHTNKTHHIISGEMSLRPC